MLADDVEQPLERLTDVSGGRAEPLAQICVARGCGIELRPELVGLGAGGLSGSRLRLRRGDLAGGGRLDRRDTVAEARRVLGAAGALRLEVLLRTVALGVRAQELALELPRQFPGGEQLGLQAQPPARSRLGADDREPLGRLPAGVQAGQR